MSAPRLVHLDDVTPQRWRNGGGWTRELLVEPAGDHWRVRVSVADIDQDGPFSAFPGVRRHLAVLQGAGVALTIDGATQRVLRGGAPVSFAGDAVTACRLLDGPTRDLNLMVRGGDGAMRAVAPGAAFTPAAVACGVFTAAAGTCRTGDRTVALPAFALAWFDVAPVSLLFDAPGWWLAA